MSVDEIYLIIAQNIANSIQSEDWNKATLNIQGDDSYVDTTGEYLDSNDVAQSLDVHNFDADVDFAIMELHEITTEGGNNKWNKAIFTLTPDGGFDMEFIWDQELQNEIDRLANE
ncbi:hypothetical protein M2T70_11525 [Elizabethkingia anophelis]|uniref:hypothetical protein n=1 Tax=Elizabethkingia anophelis TaxID=1117645 RepID=UPI0009949A38|nr:hypothetical protein [Elizabethkingia anophelis]AQW99499.1 hypothetical protein BBD31_17060 [Elizabethkingia anophelis]AQX90047.1 hypothetical protein AYC67_13895 [Elizabethkingia anophelis]ASV79366.1 hypothetical protein A6J37_12435 [Elizabethkingia anophelis]EHM7980426.1 hypothetical protein [Elizabethkingia anophelis]EHM8031645.1 hypothetical protein [Elizabethkingia anophelis]